MRHAILAIGLTLMTMPQGAVAAETRYAHSYATSGDGSPGSPYVGWEAAFASDTQVIFQKGVYECPTSPITLSSRMVITGLGGAVLQWPADRPSVNFMFILPAGSDSVTIQGLQFEAGVSVPEDGLPLQGGLGLSRSGRRGAAAL
jgi:hypothetical protein